MRSGVRRQKAKIGWGTLRPLLKQTQEEKPKAHKEKRRKTKNKESLLSSRYFCLFAFCLLCLKLFGSLGTDCFSISSILQDEGYDYTAKICGVNSLHG
jgi:hypothetical protein